MSESTGSAPPFGRYERTLAARYLRAKRAHGGVAMISIIALVGIALAVAVLIITMSVMNGFRETLLSRILGVDGHVYVDTRGAPTEEVNRWMEEAHAIPGVLNVSPIINGQGLAIVDGTPAPVVVRGIRRSDLQRLRVISDTIIPANALDNFVGVEAPDIIVGDGLAYQLGLRPGQSISLLSPQGVATPFGMSPRQKLFNIGGTFNTEMEEYDNMLVYMPLEQAQIMFNRAAGVDQLELRLQNPDATLPIMVELCQKMGSDWCSGVNTQGSRLQDWTYRRGSLVGALVVERNVMRLILMMIIAIAALNILSGLVMLVKNKSRDIAILRTMGATRGAILRIFFMAGATIGVIGTVLGLVIGVLVCTYIAEIQNFIQATTGFDLFPGSVYTLETLPAKLEWNEVYLVSGFALLMSFLATLPTARHASRLDPVEALRYE